MVLYLDIPMSPTYYYLPSINRRYKVSKSIIMHVQKRNASTRRVYRKSDYYSGDGMLTAVWGPALWHYLHTMSFNYPVKPTQEDKTHYRDFIINLQNVLPCRLCRENLSLQFKKYPLLDEHMSSRDTFSKYIYLLHERINKRLHKRSGLLYSDVRDLYEHFRARCTAKLPKSTMKLSTRTKEKGCTDPVYGKKSKCIIKIVPQEDICKTMQVDERCIKQRLHYIPKELKSDKTGIGK